MFHVWQLCRLAIVVTALSPKNGRTAFSVFGNPATRHPIVIFFPTNLPTFETCGPWIYLFRVLRELVSIYLISAVVTMDGSAPQSSRTSFSQSNIERCSLESHREIEALRCVLPWLPQRDLCAAACACRDLRTAAYQPALWKCLSLQGATNASARLAQALPQPRFSHLEHLNLEFAQPITDADLLLLQGKPLVSLNLNACQQVTDQGVTAAAKLLPNLRSFSLYWNLKVTDSGVKQVVLRCSSLQSLNLSGCKVTHTRDRWASAAHLSAFDNLSGCKNITDTSLRFIANSLPRLKSLNLTRCVQSRVESTIGKSLGPCSVGF
ncbi:unnamed protein product [Closterium sp. Yama58-4]|nr:unnamed protein product [Closterium sp. Yama58-4]